MLSKHGGTHCNPSICEAEAGGSRVQSQQGLQKEFRVNWNHINKTVSIKLHKQMSDIKTAYRAE